MHAEVERLKLALRRIAASRSLDAAHRVAENALGDTWVMPTVSAETTPPDAWGD